MRLGTPEPTLLALVLNSFRPVLPLPTFPVLFTFEPMALALIAFPLPPLISNPSLVLPEIRLQSPLHGELLPLVPPIFAFEDTSVRRPAWLLGIAALPAAFVPM